MLLTDDPLLIRAAERNYNRFLVPTSMVEAKKVVRHYTRDEQADLDIKTSVNKIGEIVNLSQELNTILWDKMNAGVRFEELEPLYCDIAKLDVLSGIEIDKAKKEFAVNSVGEIKRLKKKYSLHDEDGRQIKPNFFGKIARLKGYYDSEHKNYHFHDTTMDYLQHSLNRYKAPYLQNKFTPFSELLIPADERDLHRVWLPQVNRIIGLVRNMRSQIQAIWNNSDDVLDNDTKTMIASDIRDNCYSYIKSIQLSQYTAYRLLLEIEDPQNKDIGRSLFYTLFSLPNDSFLRLIDASREGVPSIEEVQDGDYDYLIYSFRYEKTSP